MISITRRSAAISAAPRSRKPRGSLALGRLALGERESLILNLCLQIAGGFYLGPGRQATIALWGRNPFPMGPDGAWTERTRAEASRAHLPERTRRSLEISAASSRNKVPPGYSRTAADRDCSCKGRAAGRRPVSAPPR